MHEVPFKKRIKQFFCIHIHYPVILTDDYEEIVSQKKKRVVVYECEKCEHTHINKTNIREE